MENSQGVSVSQTMAPLYWARFRGFFAQVLSLGGITIVQAYIYFPARQDKGFVRFMAATMLVFDMTSSVLIAQSVYYYLTTHYGSSVPFSSLTPELSAECLVSTMITFMSQAFFAHQLYIVKRLDRYRWLVLGSIAGCAGLAFAGGIACVTTMYIFHLGVLFTRNGTFSIFFGLAKGFGAATDLIATVAMCMYLDSSRTGIKGTSTLLNKLMLFVIRRGALVTLIQTLLLISFYAAPRNIYWIAFHFNVTKLYANTFFAMLNGRTKIREKLFRHSTMLQKLAFQNEGSDLRVIELEDIEDIEAIVSVDVLIVATTVEGADVI